MRSSWHDRKVLVYLRSLTGLKLVSVYFRVYCSFNCEIRNRSCLHQTMFTSLLPEVAVLPAFLKQYQSIFTVFYCIHNCDDHLFISFTLTSVACPQVNNFWHFWNHIQTLQFLFFFVWEHLYNLFCCLAKIQIVKISGVSLIQWHFEQAILRLWHKI